MPSLINTSFTAFVGIDWADSKHDVCLQVAGESTRQFSRIDHTPESIERWALALHHAYGAPIAVAVELTKDLWSQRFKSTTSLFYFQSIPPPWPNTAKPLFPAAQRMIQVMRSGRLSF